MKPIILIVIIIVCIIIGIVALIMKRSNKKKKARQLSRSQITANEFINVKDIRDKYLYTLDGQIIMYIKINPISIELLSQREKEQLSKSLTAELSSEREPFKFIAVSRPVDISNVTNNFMSLIASTNDRIRKNLLRNEILSMSEYALSGEVVERQFYLMVWDSENNEGDLYKRCNVLKEKFNSVNIDVSILNEQEIIRLCNLINNPAYVHLEDVEYDRTITRIQT
ncbi:hypothetical protein [Maledivibacter halophilus]|uniref:Uncharacterized protein n=1 Tax=Maledivibacter halophilus TaxID=36842 RepID=A0A1T5LVQ6_9FIRM|nr:hypothetical protein [Maledivibacter halophilus]SKC79965.1 hypothetical protein SAMN02194393_03399 [Maledivibacter halophilus]